MIFKRTMNYEKQLIEEKEKLRNIDYWTSYLKTASMQYKHSFDIQTAIHAANPKATACAGADFWNSKDCNINPDAKPIYVSVNGRTQKLFDVSDVTGQFKTSYWIWSMTDKAFDLDFTETVNSKLNEKYKVNSDVLEETLYDIALRKTAEKLGAESELYNIVSESAAFVAIHRCCPDMAEMTPESLNGLSSLDIDEIGQGVTAVAREILNEVEKIVKQERIEIIKRSIADEHEQDREQEVPKNSNSKRSDNGVGRTDRAVLSDQRQADTSNRGRNTELPPQSGNVETGRDTLLENRSPMATDKPNIIGNTEFKYIPQKSYRKFNNSVAEKMIPLINKSGIKYSGKVTDSETTFTVSRSDVEKLMRFAEQAKENEVLETDEMIEDDLPDYAEYNKEKFTKNPDTWSITWDYYNPEGNNGMGQFVSIQIYDDDIKKAINYANGNADSFIEYINSNCKTELIDRGSEDFEAFEKHFIKDNYDLVIDSNSGNSEVYNFLSDYLNELQKDVPDKPKLFTLSDVITEYYGSDNTSVESEGGTWKIQPIENSDSAELLHNGNAECSIYFENGTMTVKPYNELSVVPAMVKGTLEECMPNFKVVLEEYKKKEQKITANAVKLSETEVADNIDKKPTEEEVLFEKADLAMFLAERSLSSDMWEDMAYPLFENGYLEKHRPSVKGAYSYRLSEPEFYDIARRYRKGEDIRKELALGLLEHRGKEDIEFVFDNGKISDRTYYYPHDRRLSLHKIITDNGFNCSFNGMERFVSFEDIGKAFLDRTYEEFDDISYWWVRDEIMEQGINLTDDTVKLLIDEFDSAKLHGWDTENDPVKINRIKKALDKVLGDYELTEKVFAIIAKEKYHVTIEKKLITLQDVVAKYFGNDCESAESADGTWKLSVAEGDKAGELYHNGVAVCGVYNLGDKMSIEPYEELTSFPKMLADAMIQHNPDKSVEIKEFERTFETPLDKAKYYIDVFCEHEYGKGGKGDYDDLHNVGIAYTTLTDDELPVQITADLVDFKMTYEFDGEVYDVEQYDSLENMIENNLKWLDFDTLVSVPEDVIERHTKTNESTLHFGMLGNGTTVYDTSRTDKETNDYPTVAHISDEGVVNIYDNTLSESNMQLINNEAQKSRQDFYAEWNKLTLEVQYKRLLDRADITTLVNINHESLTIKEKIEKYMPFVFFKEGERPESEQSENVQEQTENAILKEAFMNGDIASLIAKDSLSSNDWEELANPLFKNGYIDKYKPSEKAILGSGGLSEVKLYELADRFRNGEDIREELAYGLLKGEFARSANGFNVVLSDGKLVKESVFTPKGLEKHMLRMEYGDDGHVRCTFDNNYERFLTYKEIGQMFIDRIREEWNDLAYWAVLDYIKDDIPDISDDTVKELITAFDNNIMHDWENDTVKTNRIKSALNNILDDEDKTEKAFACIAKRKYNVVVETKQAEKKSELKYQIYQLPSGEKYHGIRFESMEQLVKDGVLLNHEDYDLVYEGTLDSFEGNSTLESIYTRFNTNHPDDFKGHSISMSDVIVVKIGDEKTAYYCNDIGFTEMPNFFKEKEIATENQISETPVNEKSVQDRNYVNTPFIDGINVHTALINELLSGQCLQHGKEYVQQYFDEHSMTTEELAEFIKSEYGTGGHNGEGKIKRISYNENGITLDFSNGESYLHSWHNAAIALKFRLLGRTYLSETKVEKEKTFEELQVTLFDEGSIVENEKSPQISIINLRKVGDFYEVYGDEAITVSEQLGLHLTVKNGLEMVGFPDFKKSEYSNKLRDAGYTVLIEEVFELNPPKREELDNAVEEVAEENIGEIPENYTINVDEYALGGVKSKFKANVEAIKMMKQLDRDGRKYANPEEQAVMAKYTGWGGLANAFDENRSDWSDEYAQLKELLTDEEYTSARSTVTDAFYTPPFIIHSIYKALDNFGFMSGKILDPSTGIGNFIGMMPAEMKNRSKITATEIDRVSGRIAQYLYPLTNVEITGFEKKNLADNSFDVVVGNIPFGSYKINDRRYNKHNFAIHDYFVAKSLDKVRAGGIVAFITSTSTMDKQNNSVRKYISDRAELLGAIRLPNNAFKSYAGTEVTSDIIFLKKREHTIDMADDWVYTGEYQSGDEKYPMNNYFLDNPDMVLGNVVLNKLYGRGTSVEAFENVDLKDLLEKAVSKIKGKYIERTEEITEEKELENAIPAEEGVRNFSYTLVDDKIYYRQGNSMLLQDFTGKKKERVVGMIAISACVHELLDMQLEGYPEMSLSAKRLELNEQYEKFTKKHGLLNSRENVSAFSEDVSAPLLLSLENVKDGKLIGKADIFTKTTLKPPEKVTSVTNAHDALIVSISEKARVDLDFMSKLLGGMDKEQIVMELKGDIYYSPEDEEYQTADEYLSGNIRNKLKIAKAFLAENPDMADNISALEKAMPEPLQAADIVVKLGASWVDTKYIEQFIYEKFEIPITSAGEIKVGHNNYSAYWNVENKSYLSAVSRIVCMEKYGTKRKNALEILEASLNQRDISVYDMVYNPEKERDERVIVPPIKPCRNQDA